MVELRKAFQDDPKNPQFIKTFPKLGYSLRSVQTLTTPEEVPEPPARSKRPLILWIAAAAVVLLAAVALVRWQLQPPDEPDFLEIAWWKLDQTAGQAVIDSAGRGGPGTIAGRARWVNDHGRRAIWLEGGESGITGRANRLPAGSAPRTISVWFRTAMSGDGMLLFGYGSDFRGPTMERVRLQILGDGRLDFGAPIEGGRVVGAGRWNDDVWHQATIAYDGPPANLVRIFVDGVLDTEQNLLFPLATPRDSTWKIGANTSVGGSAFRGYLADLRIYERALDTPKVFALYRCSAGIKDLDDFYFIPIFLPGVVLDKRGPGEVSTPLRNGGFDYTGIQLGRSNPDRGFPSLIGADVGQDLHLAVDLLVPEGPRGETVEAGPYFRCRRSAAGDGLIGGASAGYWVQLNSRGLIAVRRLNPTALVGLSAPAADFDSSVFHHIEMEARGETLEVWLDGKPVTFRDSGTRIAVPPVWDGPPRIGHNGGAAGIVFSAMDNRGRAGGQRARNLQIRPLHRPKS